jgi:hypothetical protein
MANFYEFINILSKLKEASSDGWPEDEAYGEADYILELIKDAGDDSAEIDYIKNLIKEKLDHWTKIFDVPGDLPAFIAKFNSMMPSENFYMKDPNDKQSRMF